MKVAVTLSSRDYDAVLFDLDRVLTRTARVHATAWMKLFDGVLEQRATKVGTPFTARFWSSIAWRGAADYLVRRR